MKKIYNKKQTEWLSKVQSVLDKCPFYCIDTESVKINEPAVMFFCKRFYIPSVKHLATPRKLELK